MYYKLTDCKLQGDRHPGDYTSRADRLLNKDLFEIINEGLYRYEEVGIFYVFVFASCFFTRFTYVCLGWVEVGRNGF